MNEDNDGWLPAGQALELVAYRFAHSMKVDATRAREEAKEAIIGDLASGRVFACPKGCLTSSWIAGEGSHRDFSFVEFDADGNGHEHLMEQHQMGNFLMVPQEFWEMFRDPTAGASANWQDGHFSFRVEKSPNCVFVGALRQLFLQRAGLPGLTLVPNRNSPVDDVAPKSDRQETRNDGISATVNNAFTRERAKRGQPPKARAFYSKLHQQRFRDGLSIRANVEEAEFLHNAVKEVFSGKDIPNIKTIINYLSKYGYGKSS